MATPTSTMRMTRSWPWKMLSILGLILVSLGLLIGLAAPQKTPRLGIDLQGGTRVTLVPQGASPTQEQLSQARLILENRVNGMGVTGAQVVVDGSNLVITVPGADTEQARALGQTSQLLFRAVAYPEQVDDSAVLEATEQLAEEWIDAGVVTAEYTTVILDQMRANVEMLANGESPTETQLAEQVQVAADAATRDAEQLREGTGTTVTTAGEALTAREERNQLIDTVREGRQSEDAAVQAAAAALLNCQATDPLAGNDDPARPLITCDEQGQTYLLAPAPILVGEEDTPDAARLSGNEIDTNAPIQGGYNSQTGQVEINFRFATGDKAGGETWAKMTSDYLNQQVAITLDTRILSAPVIRGVTPAGSSTQITGDFTQQQAQEMANNLRYGALPLSFAGENGEKGGTATTIPASLGIASLEAGLIAGGIGLILVSLFCLAYYRLLGFIPILSLVVAGLMVYAVITLLGNWIGYSLDLAGVAGLIIGIGTTADSYVVFFERVKDEVRTGRSFRSAVPRAWKRAQSTIWAGNFVSLIGAFVLYFLAVGDVRGFAFTLGLTTIFDLVTVFFLTAPLVVLASRSELFSKTWANGLGSVTRAAEERQAYDQAAHPDVDTAASRPTTAVEA